MPLLPFSEPHFFWAQYERKTSQTPGIFYCILYTCTALLVTFSSYVATLSKVVDRCHGNTQEEDPSDITLLFFSTHQIQHFQVLLVGPLSHQDLLGDEVGAVGGEEALK